MDLISGPYRFKDPSSNDGDEMNLLTCIRECVLNSLNARAVSVAVRYDLPTGSVQIVDDGSGISNRALCELDTAVSDPQTLTNHKRGLSHRGKNISKIISLSEKVEILTRNSRNLHAFEKIWIRGENHQIRTTHRSSVGTTVTVHNFLLDQSNVISEEELKDVMIRIALIHPMVSFTAVNLCNHQILISTSKKDNILARFADFYGTRYSKNLRCIQYEDENLKINGLVSLKPISDPKLQFFYVNKRFLLRKSEVYTYLEYVYKKYVLKAASKHPLYVMSLKCSVHYYEQICGPSTIFLHNVFESAFKSFFSQNTIYRENQKNDVIQGTYDEIPSKKFDVNNIYGAVCGDVIEKEVIKSSEPVQKVAKKSKRIRSRVLKQIEAIEKSELSMPEILIDKFLKSVIVTNQLGGMLPTPSDDEFNSSEHRSLSSQSNSLSLDSLRPNKYVEEEDNFLQHLETIMGPKKRKTSVDINGSQSIKTVSNKKLATNQSPKIDVQIENITETGSSKLSQFLTKKSQRSSIVVEEPAIESTYFKPKSCNGRELDPQPVGFKLQKRCVYLPKGFSPTVSHDDVSHVPELSPGSKQKLHAVVFQGDSIRPTDLNNRNYDFEELFQQFCCGKTDKNVDVNNITTKILSSTAKKLMQNLNSVSFTKELFKNIKFIGQIDNKFLATLCKVQNGDLIILFDQHAVHERIRLEDFLKEFVTNDNGKLLKSEPVEETIFSVNNLEIEMIRNTQKELNRIGFEFELKSNEIALKAAPTCLRSKIDKLQTCFRKVVDEIDKSLRHCEQLHSVPMYLQNVINTKACRGAIRFGDNLTRSQCEELLNNLSKCTLPFQCAHGRPSLMPIFDMKQID